MEYKYWSIASNLVIRAKCFLRWTKAATTIIVMVTKQIIEFSHWSPSFSTFIHFNQYIRSVYHTHTHTQWLQRRIKSWNRIQSLSWGTLLAIWSNERLNGLQVILLRIELRIRRKNAFEFFHIFSVVSSPKAPKQFTSPVTDTRTHTHTHTTHNISSRAVCEIFVWF